MVCLPADLNPLSRSTSCASMNQCTPNNGREPRIRPSTLCPFAAPCRHDCTPRRLIWGRLSGLAMPAPGGPNIAAVLVGRVQLVMPARPVALCKPPNRPWAQSQVRGCPCSMALVIQSWNSSRLSANGRHLVLDPNTCGASMRGLGGGGGQAFFFGGGWGGIRIPYEIRAFVQHQKG